MQQVVPGVQITQVTQALFAALGVHAGPAKIFGRRALEELQIRPPEHPERLERLGRIGVGIVQSLRPEILIVAGDRRPVLRQDQSHPPGPDDVGVGEVLEHRRDGPLAGALGLPQLVQR